MPIPPPRGRRLAKLTLCLALGVTPGEGTRMSYTVMGLDIERPNTDVHLRTILKTEEFFLKE